MNAQGTPREVYIFMRESPVSFDGVKYDYKDFFAMNNEPGCHLIVYHGQREGRADHHLFHDVPRYVFRGSKERTLVGRVVRVARIHNVSRPFVYDLVVEPVEDIVDNADAVAACMTDEECGLAVQPVPHHISTSGPYKKLGVVKHLNVPWESIRGVHFNEGIVPVK